MSLLLEAMKKADARRQTLRTTSDTPTDLSLAEPYLGPDTTLEAPVVQPDLDRRIHYTPNPLSDQHTAQTLFASPARSKHTRIVSSMAILALLALAVGVYYYQTTAPENKPPLTNTLPPPSLAQPQSLPAPIALQAQPEEHFIKAAPKQQFAPTAPLPPTPKSPLHEAKEIAIERKITLPEAMQPIQAAYHAFIEGNYPQAEQLYQQALSLDPLNRDALLGLAALAVKSNRQVDASKLYARILTLNPNDDIAQAALISLESKVHPEQAEAFLKRQTAKQPSAALAFSLANLYAMQHRWPEAQQAYFQAYSQAPNQPDYAFNLAVSLEQLKQLRLAIDYFTRALDLAEHSSVSFDKEQARQHLEDLKTRLEAS